jgi:hypothetical protein
MAMTIFLVLNGLGVVFLLYVLAGFWKEGHRPNHDAGESTAEFKGRNWTDMIVITHPISPYAQGGTSVIPFPGRGGQKAGKPFRETASHEISALPARRVSTK